MAMKRIVVDLSVVDKSIQKFIGTLQNLKKFLQVIDGIMKVLSVASWISPASKALYAKYQLLKRQVEEAIRIVDEYLHDLMTLRTQYGNVEKALQDKIGALKTDVFGI